MSRELDRAVRRFADANSTRIADASQSSSFYATVISVAAGSGGRSTVQVSWRGATLTAASYNTSFTPAVGQRVTCRLISSQLHIDGAV